MLTKRLLARLDIKGEHLIHPIRMEGLRKLGDPHEFAVRYNEAGIDEILYVDTVASLYGRSHLAELVARTADHTFCPITVAGGIRSVEDAKTLFLAGADKIALNTAATSSPELITHLADRFGSQAVVAQIDAKRSTVGWEAWREGGREPTGKQVHEWAVSLVDLGAGEILLTSIDQQGTGKGFDLELIKAVAADCRVPLIASGGMAHYQDGYAAIQAGADGIAMASRLHGPDFNIPWLRWNFKCDNIPMRPAA